MKHKLFVSAVAVLFLCSAALVPSKTKEKNILGKWKLHLDISKKIKQETKDEEGLGKAFARGIGSLVDELVSEVEITFEFKKNNVLIVTQNNNWNDEDKVEIEEYTWEIDKKGRIKTISLKNKHLSVDNNEGWILKNKRLIPMDKDDDLENIVWLEKIK